MLQVAVFAFLLFPKYLTSEPVVLEEEYLSSTELESLMKILFPTNNVCNCHYIKSHNKIDRVIGYIHQLQCISLVIGDTVKNSLCKEHIFIIGKESDFDELNVIFNSDYIRIIVLIIIPTCPADVLRYIDRHKFGVGQIIISCVLINSIYIYHNSTTLMKMDKLTTSSGTILKLPNYGGKFLRVSTFNCPVYSYGTEDNIRSSSNDLEQLDGIEMKIFLEISKRLNFTWRLEEPQELNKWGQKFSNGTWSGGIVGALVKKSVDIGFCCLWLASPQAEDVDLTMPWNILCSTLLVPRPRRLQKLGAVFYPFTTSLWAVLVAATFSISMILWCIQRVRQQAVSSGKVFSLCRNFQHFIGIISMGSMPSAYVQINECRHISTWWAVFALLMTTAYSSSLVSHLTVPLFDTPLNSVRDLVMADVHWSQSYFPAVDVIFDLENSWHRRFIKYFELDPETAKVHHAFHITDHASLGFVLEGDRPYFLEPIPMNPSLLPSLRVMKECVSRYYISIGLTKNSPYTAALNEVMSRLIESGVIKYWQKDVVLRHTTPQMTQVFEDSDGMVSGPEVLKLKNLEGAFLLLFCGLCFACVTMFVERYILNKNAK
ncbi:Ionotropic receptor 104 [Blattella germanica]|nr:Ionotropic receptor 104 [Blattella germanica]